MSVALPGTSWSVTGPFPIGDGLAATMVFDDDVVAGSTGCNRFHAGYSAEGSTIRLGPIATTRMLGTPEAMELERKVLSALDRASTWGVLNDRLVLRSGDGSVVLQLVASTEPADQPLRGPGS